MAILGAAVTFIVIPYFDGDPATVINISGFVTGAIAGFGLIFAKDFNVSNSPSPLPTGEAVK